MPKERNFFQRLGKGTIRPLLTFSIDGVFLSLEIYKVVNQVDINTSSLGALAMVATSFWFGGRSVEKFKGNA